MVNVRLLGAASVGDAQASVAGRLLHEPVRFAVFVFIAACRTGYAPRDSLIGLLWPDEPRAHALNALRQAVYRIRACVGKSALVTLGNGDLCVDPAFVDVDVMSFVRAYDEGRHEEVMSCYRGSFLQHFPSTGRRGFDDWVGRRRVELRAMAGKSAVTLARRAQDEGRLRDAAEWWGRAMSLSDHDEVILRQWMECLALAGSRGRALAVFERAAEDLWKELEIGVSRETAALAAAIRGDAAPARARSRLRDEQEAAFRGAGRPTFR